MTDVQPRIDRAWQVVENYTEAWKDDRLQATECAEFEADLAEGIAVFRLLESVRPLVERFVVHTHGLELWEKFKALYAQLAGASDVRLHTLSVLEREFGTVVNGPEFRECSRKAHATLAAWPIIPAPKAVGSRLVPLSEDEAAELHALQAAPPEAPGKLRTKPQALPLADESLLK